MPRMTFCVTLLTTRTALFHVIQHKLTFGSRASRLTGLHCQRTVIDTMVHISIRLELHALLFYIVCTNCIVIFSSLLHVSSVFFSHHTLSSFSIKLHYRLGCIPATFTCMQQAGWGPYPTLAFTHSRVGHAPHSLAHPLPCRVCRCHPYFITHFQGVLLPSSLLYSLLLGCVAATLLACTSRGVLPPPPFYARLHPKTCSPIYCQILCCHCQLWCMLSDRVVNTYLEWLALMLGWEICL